MLVRDLNEITKPSEKLGGRVIWKSYIFLKDFMQSVRGIDIGFSGKQFTWENKQEDQAFD